MREILFRGKTQGAGKWFQGDLVTVAHKRFIDDDIVKVRVIAETVGQYTGLTDKNGTKIFEGDIVKHYNALNFGLPNIYDIAEIYWDEKECCFKRQNKFKKETFFISNENVYEVIGNIHDNPELLKECEGK